MNTEFKTIESSEDIPSLEQAQKFVGGYVERMKLPNGSVLLFDEDGLLKQLPLNDEATKLVNSLNPMYFVTVVGNVIHLPKELRQRKW